MEQIKIIVSSFFCLAFFLPAPAAQVSYYDIINQQDPQLPYVNNSVLAQSFQQLPTRKEKIEYLLSLCEQENGIYTIKIHNIPQTHGLPTTTATLAFNIKTIQDFIEDLNLYRIPYSNLEEHVLNIRFNFDYTISMFWFSDRNLGVLSELSYFENISGSTIIRLFDGLCSLCSVGKIVLTDLSKLKEIEKYNYELEYGESESEESDEDSDQEDYYLDSIELKVLYPYIYGKTFYERFGFVPQGLNSLTYTEYIQAREYLTHRRLQEIMQDFSNKPDVYNALLEGYNELDYFPQHYVTLTQATIRDALYALYVRIKIPFNGTTRPATIKSHREYLTLLSTIYDNCLVRYKSNLNRDKTRQIKALQAKINNFEFYEKNY